MAQWWQAIAGHLEGRPLVLHPGRILIAPTAAQRPFSVTCSKRVAAGT
jgi:hypothetical protein